MNLSAILGGTMKLSAMRVEDHEVVCEGGAVLARTLAYAQELAAEVSEAEDRPRTIGYNEDGTFTVMLVLEELIKSANELLDAMKQPVKVGEINVDGQRPEDIMLGADGECYAVPQVPEGFTTVGVYQAVPSGTERDDPLLFKRLAHRLVPKGMPLEERHRYSDALNQLMVVEHQLGPEEVFVMFNAIGFEREEEERII